MRVWRFFILAWLCAAALCQASEADDFTQAEALFKDSVAGSSRATDQAVERFQKLAALPSPAAPLYRAYWGSSQTLQGRDAWLPWEKLKAVDRGLANLDKALRQAQDAPADTQFNGLPLVQWVRITAASTFVALPDLFHRFEDGKDLVRQLQQDKTFSQSPAHFRASVFSQAAKIAQREKKPADEKVWLNKVLSTEPNGPLVNATRQRLQELGS